VVRLKIPVKLNSPSQPPLGETAAGGPNTDGGSGLSRGGASRQEGDAAEDSAPDETTGHASGRQAAATAAATAAAAAAAAAVGVSSSMTSEEANVGVNSPVGNPSRKLRWMAPAAIPPASEDLLYDGGGGDAQGALSGTASESGKGPSRGGVDADS